MALQSAGIGARLLAGREKLGLTVLQVAERIHTDPKIVEAIEVDNYAALGAPVYARGHIRHYAELVGESATELIGVYSEQSQVGQPDLTRIVKVTSPGDSNKLVLPALLIIAVFAIAGAIWWVSALSKKKPQLSETHVVGQEQPGTSENPKSGGAEAGSGQPQPPARTDTAGGSSIPPQAAGSGADGAVGQARIAAGAASSGAGASGTGAQRYTGIGSAGGRGSNGAGSTPASGQPATPSRVASAGAASGSKSASSSTAAVPVLPRSKNQAQVTLRYSADSWTEVYDATGARLFYDVGSANSTQTVVGTPPLRVVLGNASGVAVEFNGHSTPIAKLAHPDGSVQFSINRSGRVIRAKPVADGG